MNENELVVYYRARRFEILAVILSDGLYRAVVAESTTGKMDYWELKETVYKTAHELFLSYVGSIMEYVDAATEAT